MDAEVRVGGILSRMRDWGWVGTRIDAGLDACGGRAEDDGGPSTLFPDGIEVFVDDVDGVVAGDVYHSYVVEVGIERVELVHVVLPLEVIED